MDSAEHYFKIGNEKLDNCLFEEAIYYYNKVIGLKPDYAEAYLNLGFVKAVLGRCEEALDDCMQAIAKAPNLEAAYNVRGQIYASLKQYEAALDDFDQVIDKYCNDDALVYYNRGLVNAELSRYKAAIYDYGQAIVLNPDYAAAYNNRGQIYAKLKQYEAALDDFGQAIALNPDLGLTYYNVGLVKGDLGQNKEAIANFDIAIAKDPDIDMAYLSRGRAKANLDLYKEAIADYNQFLMLNPKYAIAYFDKGVAKFKLGQNKEAIANFDEAIVLDSYYTAAHNNRGLAKFELGHYKEAIDDYDEAIVLDPDYAAAYNNRGFAKAELGQYAESITDFDKAIILDSDYAGAYLNRGNVYRILNNWPEAQRNFVRFVRLADQQALADQLSPLVMFFCERSYVPYLMKAIFQRLPWVNNLWSYQPVLKENQLKCAGFDLYLDYLEYKKYSEMNPRGFSQLKAFIHYYMGDPIEAFRIFDALSDYDNRHPLSLSEHYYYLKSAHDCLEPAESKESIVQGALNRAKQYAERFKNGTVHDPVELYYAGLIFYLNRSWTEAQGCFERSNHFLPAAYMQVLTLSELKQLAAQTAKIAEIRSRESQLTREQGFLRGFQPQDLSDSPTRDFALLRRYAYYTEISQAISAVRQPTDPAFRHREFSESYTVNLSADEKDKVAIYRQERKKKFLQQAIEDQLAQWLNESETARLTQVLPTEMEELMEEVQQTFHTLEAVAMTNGDMEKALVRVIANWKFSVYSNCEQLYSKLIIYYHLKQKLSLQQTFYLVYFVLFTRHIRQLYLEGNSGKALETLKAGGLEGFTDTSKEVIKELFKPQLIVILPIAAAFTACFFSSVVIKIGLNLALRWLTSIHQERKINPNALQPYLEFKKALEENIGHIFQFGPNAFIDEFTLSEFEALHRKLEDIAA